MKIVYVAGKFRGPHAWAIERNIRAAEEIGFEVAQMGACPMIPHANTRYFHGTCDDDFWLDATMALLRRCDAVVMVPGWELSVGARAEKLEAERLGMPVFEDLDALAVWLDEGEEEVEA